MFYFCSKIKMEFLWVEGFVNKYKIPNTTKTLPYNRDTDNTMSTVVLLDVDGHNDNGDENSVGVVIAEGKCCNCNSRKAKQHCIHSMCYNCCCLNEAADHCAAHRQQKLKKEGVI